MPPAKRQPLSPPFRAQEESYQPEVLTPTGLPVSPNLVRSIPLRGSGFPAPIAPGADLGYNGDPLQYDEPEVLKPSYNTTRVLVPASTLEASLEVCGHTVFIRGVPTADSKVNVATETDVIHEVYLDDSSDPIIFFCEGLKSATLMITGIPFRRLRFKKQSATAASLLYVTVFNGNVNVRAT